MARCNVSALWNQPNQDLVPRFSVVNAVRFSRPSTCAIWLRDKSRHSISGLRDDFSKTVSQFRESDLPLSGTEIDSLDRVAFAAELYKRIDPHDIFEVLDLIVVKSKLPQMFETAQSYREGLACGRTTGSKPTLPLTLSI